MQYENSYYSEENGVKRLERYILGKSYSSVKVSLTKLFLKKKNCKRIALKSKYHWADVTSDYI